MSAPVFHRLGEIDAAPVGQTVLGGVAYGLVGAVSDASLLRVAVQTADGAAAVASRFLTDAPVRRGQLGPVTYGQTDELVFGTVCIDETTVAGGLHAATAEAYAAIFAALDTLGYPTLLRAWNYLPGINREQGGLERYRQFNAGRQQAFAASQRPLSGRVPAACALGTPAGRLSIAFLGSVTPFVPVENPRQVSAYHYPPEYGERSPTFSRAGLTRIGGHDVLFISGTAAIVGHQSLHGGDAVAQTRETLTNLAAVIDAANAYPGNVHYRLDALDYTVYVRHLADAPAVLAVVREAIGPAARVICVQADVCRAELLVEIEAVGGLPSGAGA